MFFIFLLLFVLSSFVHSVEQRPPMRERYAEQMDRDFVLRQSEWKTCDGKLVEVMLSEQHCGRCNHMCEENEKCTEGKCTPM